MAIRHPQDDLLILIALARYSADVDEFEPENAARAWEMAIENIDHHYLEPIEAVH